MNSIQIEGKAGSYTVKKNNEGTYMNLFLIDDLLRNQPGFLIRLAREEAELALKTVTSGDYITVKGIVSKIADDDIYSDNEYIEVANAQIVSVSKRIVDLQNSYSRSDTDTLD